MSLNDSQLKKVEPAIMWKRNYMRWCGNLREGALLRRNYQIRRADSISVKKDFVATHADMWKIILLNKHVWPFTVFTTNTAKPIQWNVGCNLSAGGRQSLCDERNIDLGSFLHKIVKHDFKRILRLNDGINQSVEWYSFGYFLIIYGDSPLNRPVAGKPAWCLLRSPATSRSK